MEFSRNSQNKQASNGLHLDLKALQNQQESAQKPPQQSVYHNIFAQSHSYRSQQPHQMSDNGSSEQMASLGGPYVPRNKNFGIIPPGSLPFQMARDNFHCGCGQVLAQQKIQQHQAQCATMNNEYYDIFKAIKDNMDDIIPARDEQKLRNLRSYLGFFIVQINEKLKVSDCQKAAGYNSARSVLISDRSSKMSAKKSIEIPLKDFNLQEKYQQENKLKNQQEQKQLQNEKKLKRPESHLDVVMEDLEENKTGEIEHQPPAEKDTCVVCRTIFTKPEEEHGMKIMLVSSCFHFVHKSCLFKTVLEQVQKTQKAVCPLPDCGQQIQESEYTQYFTEEQKQQLDSIFLNFLKQNSNFVVCKCGHAMVLEPGQVDYKQKDDQGRLLTREAALHMSKFRVRCQCGLIFCSKCNEEPYHLGMTCEQLKAKRNARKCRFCQSNIDPLAVSTSSKPAFKNVCNDPGCQELMQKSCDKIHPCGHLCVGVANETHCLPCLNCDCVKQNQQLSLGQNEDAYCNICGVDRLGERPCVQFDCKHIFHVECVMNILNRKWGGPRISFNFLNCTQCKQKISASSNPEISAFMEKMNAYETDLRKKAIERGKSEGLDKDKRLKDPSYHHYNRFEDFCVQKVAFFECYECKQPYFGGMKECLQNQEEQKVNEEYKKEELVCAKCASSKVQGGVNNCKKHGTDYIEFKCKFCCNIAQWFCWGNTHFCEECHKKQNAGNYLNRKPRSDLPKCPGYKKCPLKIKHPENGEEYALGCALCRELQQLQ